MQGWIWLCFWFIEQNQNQLSLVVSLARTASAKFCKKLFSWSINPSPLMKHNVLFKRFRHYILPESSFIPRTSNQVSLKSFQYYSLTNSWASELFWGFPGKIRKYLPNPPKLYLCHLCNYPRFCVPRSIWQIPGPCQQNRLTLKQFTELF